MNCPYCALRVSDSDDHIFPKFLGGRVTVPTCNQCNSTFGHTIEASAFEHFKDWMFMFRRSGMAPPRPMMWRRAAIGDSGRRYDVDQDFNAVLSDPIITRDDEGQISRVEGSPKKLTKIAKSLQEKGEKFMEPEVSKITIDSELSVRWHPLLYAMVQEPGLTARQNATGTPIPRIDQLQIFCVFGVPAGP